MKALHNLLKGMSLTTALFIFQSCYGMPQGLRNDLFEANLKLEDSRGNALDGVRVSVRNDWTSDWVEQARSDGSGNAGILIPYNPQNAFVDIRLEAEGFATKDTTITDMSGGDIKIVLKDAR